MFMKTIRIISYLFVGCIIGKIHQAMKDTSINNNKNYIFGSPGSKITLTFDKKNTTWCETEYRTKT